jgi:hypothetical protein
MGRKQQIFIWVFLSFPQFLSNGALVLHEFFHILLTDLQKWPELNPKINSVKNEASLRCVKCIFFCAVLDVGQ